MATMLALCFAYANSHRLDVLSMPWWGDYETLVIGIVQLISRVGDEIVVAHWLF
ncbi:MAG: hypothetical protein PHF42_13135 [Pseudomonas sp.]|jgi:hypothetical protein|nr:hypothetical protein [Pseudomonas sp.]